ncbi:MAG: helix-turn-helix transcriptional regulator [Clostridia bacterium]|nr:helix-turn-helix transcriptional regulator [Clostridia bacterium]
MIFHLCRESITHKTEGFPMAYYSVDKSHPRYVMMHHWHPEAELLLLRRGTLTLTVDGISKRMTEGQFALIPHGTVHSGIPEDAWYECVVFDGAGLTEILQGSTKKKAAEILSQFRIGPCQAPLPTLTETLRCRQRGYQTEALAALFALLTEWIRSPEPRQEPRSEGRKFRLASFEQAILFLREHYADPITLQDLSHAAGLSEKYFGEYFKNITGKTPIRYLNEYRVERAAELLKRGDKSITEIALECGFSDLSYFIKTFRNHYGTSPGNYRKGKKET